LKISQILEKFKKRFLDLKKISPAFRKFDSSAVTSSFAVKIVQKVHNLT
jgi:hypothetical protein